jgi:sugar O-acyltransferase (sialic acid O-acetyltransferase NeuD family)
MGVIEKMRSNNNVLDGMIKGMYFLDDNFVGKKINGYKVLAGIDKVIKDNLHGKDEHFIVAFGTTYMKRRKEVFILLQKRQKKLFSAIHPNVSIDKNVALGSGIIIAGNCLVNPNASIGDNCVLCAGVIVEHDCWVDNHVYLSPGVCLAGASRVNDGAFIGTNASILPEVEIGADSIVGAGAVVIKDVPAGTVVAGVPAKILKEKKR